MSKDDTDSYISGFNAAKYLYEREIEELKRKHADEMEKALRLIGRTAMDIGINIGSYPTNTFTACNPDCDCQNALECAVYRDSRDDQNSPFLDGHNPFTCPECTHFDRKGGLIDDTEQKNPYRSRAEKAKEVIEDNRPWWQRQYADPVTEAEIERQHEEWNNEQTEAAERYDARVTTYKLTNQPDPFGLRAKCECNKVAEWNCTFPNCLCCPEAEAINAIAEGYDPEHCLGCGGVYHCTCPYDECSECGLESGHKFDCSSNYGEDDDVHGV